MIKQPEGSKNQLLAHLVEIETSDVSAGRTIRVSPDEVTFTQV
jgi:hypothetical protein